MTRLCAACHRDGVTSPAATLNQCDRCGKSSTPEEAQEPERQAEQQGWHEIHSLVDALSHDELQVPGYYAEGWSACDMVGHIGAWLAEGGKLLEQMAAGTYREGELDVDAANARFFELMRGLPPQTILLQAWAARWRMLAAWSQLPAPRPSAADRWLDKAGAAHYGEHLPRLREWSADLLARRQTR